MVGTDLEQSSQSPLPPVRVPRTGGTAGFLQSASESFLDTSNITDLKLTTFRSVSVDLSINIHINYVY